MLIQVVRLQDNGTSTIGTMHINGTFEGFTLEDTFNEPKIPGNTRIPAGTYEIKLRTEGGMHSKYSTKYGDKHEGMLWLQDVPNFEWVYIHTGNTHDHTEGCLLVGTSCDASYGKQSIGNSVMKYKDIYAQVVAALHRGEDVTIQII